MRIAFSSSGAASVPANSWQIELGIINEPKFKLTPFVTHWAAKSGHVLQISSRAWAPTLTSVHPILWEGIFSE
jgi:hypothetical protein